MSFGNLKGALRWSQQVSNPESATLRVNQVRQALEKHASGGPVSNTKATSELRTGLAELDSIRSYLQDGITSTNKDFVSKGTRDADLHHALEKSLNELEEVRQKLVNTLDVSGSGNSPATRARAASHTFADAAAAASAARESKPEVGATASRPRPSSATLSSAAERLARKEENDRKFRRMVNEQSRKEFLEKEKKRATAAQAWQQGGMKRTGSANRMRPSSAGRVRQGTSATESSRVDSYDQLFTLAGKKSGGAATKEQSGAEKTEAAANPPAAPKVRPTSAPHRGRTPQPKPAAKEVAAEADDDDVAQGGGPGVRPAWGKYEEWAQNVLNRVQRRNSQSNPGTGSKQRPNSALLSRGGGNTNKESGDGPGLKGRVNSAQQLKREVNSAGTQGQQQQQQQQQRKAPGGALCPAAQQLREQGNIAFQQRKYKDAADAYGKALDIEPESDTLFCNRAAAHLMLSQYKDALADATKAIEIDSTHVKAHWRVAKAHLYLGNYEQSRQYYTLAYRLADHPADLESITAELRAVDAVEKTKRCIRLRDWQDAVKQINNVLDVFTTGAPCSTPWLCLKAEALLNVDPAEAGNIMSKVTTDDPNHADAWYLRGKALFYTGHDAVSTSTAASYAAKAKALDSKHIKAGALHSCIEAFSRYRDDGNSAYAGGRWQDAYVSYTKCLSIDMNNTSLKAIILCNRSAVCIQCERWKDALEDVNQSIQLNSNNAKAYTRRARIYQQGNNHEQAVKDLQMAVQMFPSAENQERLNQAMEMKAAAQRSKQHQFFQRHYGFQQGSSNTTAGSGGGGASASSGSTAGQTGANTGSGSTAGGNTGANYRSFFGSRAHSAPRRPSMAAAAKRQTLYDILGIQKTSDEKTIVKAYRDAALKWHPDKWASCTDEQKANAENVFKDVSHAYNTLRDKERRRQYDITIVTC